MRMWFTWLALAAVLLCFGAAVGVRLWNQHVLDEREEIMARIHVAGGRVTRDRSAAGKPAVAVNLVSSRKLTDAILTDVARLPTVRVLNLSVTRVGDEQLKIIAGMTSLEELYLGSTQITDAGLDCLRRLDRLHTLNLGVTAITDAALAKMSMFPELRELYVAGTSVSDAGLEHLRELTKLRLLDVNSTNVTNEGIQALKKGLPALEVNY